ncbi:transposase family protein [Methylobacterium terricola]|uniref:Transposase family protein n=1 Tax=Methylobacterium terricola TaxID=2583531 RepID=A0A5C4L6Q6_9HYPH|nr:transposase family protein [Methylobacterium terricola]
MARSLRHDVIVPPGLLVDRVELTDCITIIAQPMAASARCPGCDQPSSRVHSRYTQTLADLPVAGMWAIIEVAARRFRFDASGCPTRIFAERLGPDLAGPYARRTAQLENIVHQLGLALGGEWATRPRSELNRSVFFGG